MKIENHQQALEVVKSLRALIREHVGNDFDARMESMEAFVQELVQEEEEENRSRLYVEIRDLEDRIRFSRGVVMDVDIYTIPLEQLIELRSNLAKQYETIVSKYTTH